MPRRKTAIITIEEARARFGEWRQNRRGKARIPAELWSAAVAVARKEGLNRTARELHVAWDDLKRRMEAASAASPKPALPAFVELVTPRAPSLPECMVCFRQSCVIVVRRLVFRFAGRFDPEEQLVPFVMFA
jgi:hypothetical protein